MGNGWERAQELVKKHAASNGGLFIRLANDRDRVVGVFLGEPYPRETHWIGDHYEECTEDGCKYCAEGKRPSLRVLMNFYVLEERAVKIIEGGVSWFKDLKKVKDKRDLNRWLFEVERHGASGDTKTSYTIFPEKELTDEQIREINSLELHDLHKVISKGDDGFDSYDKSVKSETIDSRTSSQLISRLKAFPREAVDNLLEKFGVHRVRDLKSTDLNAVTDLIESFEGKYLQRDTDTQSKAEVDPFA